jgi:hypothetical protein
MDYVARKKLIAGVVWGGGFKLRVVIRQYDV